MSYTSVETVRRYLTDRAIPGPVVIDQRLVLRGFELVEFCNGSVEADSLVVKSVRQTRPSRAEVALSGGSAPIGSGPIVSGSVVVATDSSLRTVYAENVDYIVDYTAGRMNLKAGGAIVPSAVVTVWFQPFAVLAEGDDYSLHGDIGCIRRLADGSIADGETVWLDYEARQASFDEDLVASAVAEANGTIENEIDPSGDFGADPRLQAAATARALAIIGRAAAMRALTLHGDEGTAAAWLKLVDSFTARSDEHLTRFHPAASGPSSPTHS